VLTALGAHAAGFAAARWCLRFLVYDCFSHCFYLCCMYVCYVLFYKILKYSKI